MLVEIMSLDINQFKYSASVLEVLVLFNSNSLGWIISTIC